MTEKRDETIAVQAMNAAADVARKIWDDLCDRSGFGLECLESDDEETFKDTITSHVRIIASAMVPASTLESVTRERDARITELERLYETEQRHAVALMARVNELTKEPSDG